MKALVFNTYKEADKRDKEEAQQIGCTGRTTNWWGVAPNKAGDQFALILEGNEKLMEGELAEDIVYTDYFDEKPDNDKILDLRVLKGMNYKKDDHFDITAVYDEQQGLKILSINKTSR